MIEHTTHNKNDIHTRDDELKDDSLNRDPGFALRQGIIKASGAVYIDGK